MRSRIWRTRLRRPKTTVLQVFVTVVAGITIAYFELKLPAGDASGAMPNGGGIGGSTALAVRRFVTPQQLEEVSALFDAVGGVLTVPECSWTCGDRGVRLGSGLFSAGRGPGGMPESVGLSRQVATDLAAQTMAGSAAMPLSGWSKTRVAPRRADGCAWTLPHTAARRGYPPGGTTVAALRGPRTRWVSMAVDAAVQAVPPEQLRITPERFTNLKPIKNHQYQ